MKQAYQKPAVHPLKNIFTANRFTLNDLANVIGRSVAYCHVRINGYRLFTQAEEATLQQLAEFLKNQETGDGQPET
jgi:hypothetical protein